MIRYSDTKKNKQMSTEITILIVIIFKLFYYLVSLCFNQLILRDVEGNDKDRNPIGG